MGKNAKRFDRHAKGKVFSKIYAHVTYQERHARHQSTLPGLEDSEHQTACAAAMRFPVHPEGHGESCPFL